MLNDLIKEDNAKVGRCAVGIVLTPAATLDYARRASHVCQEGFERLAKEIVTSQQEPTSSRLMEAFQTLHTCHGACGGGLDRAGRRRFQAGMRDFVATVRSFLQTK